MIGRIIAWLWAMIAILHLVGIFIIDLFKSRSQLEAENLFLRHQLTIALRRAPPRLRLRGSDRALMVWLVRLWPSPSQCDSQLMTEEQILGFKPAARLEQLNDKHSD